MNTLELEARNTALVAIDLQRGIVATPTFPHSTEEVLRNTARIAERLRGLGGLVVYVRVDMLNPLRLATDVPPRDPNAAPPPAAALELVPEAGFRAGDLLITKRHWGAFAGTNLEQELRQRSVHTVVLTGISTNIGVESTARQGTGLGFSFVVVEDACAARDAADHRHAFEKILPRLGRVRSTEQVLGVLS
jgi:nicotinamidase-related amidase